MQIEELHGQGLPLWLVEYRQEIRAVQQGEGSAAQMSSETMSRRKSLSKARMLLAVAAALPDTISLPGT